jgi:hypothetical protein
MYKNVLIYFLPFCLAICVFVNQGRKFLGTSGTVFQCRKKWKQPARGTVPKKIGGKQLDWTILWTFSNMPPYHSIQKHVVFYKYIQDVFTSKTTTQDLPYLLARVVVSTSFADIQGEYTVAILFHNTKVFLENSSQWNDYSPKKMLIQTCQAYFTIHIQHVLNQWNNNSLN